MSMARDDDGRTLDDLRDFNADGFLPDGSYVYYSLLERRVVTLQGKVPPEAQAAVLAPDSYPAFCLSSYYNGGRVLGTPMPFGRYVLEEMPEVFDDIEPAEAARQKTSADERSSKEGAPIVLGLSPGYGF